MAKGIRKGSSVRIVAGSYRGYIGKVVSMGPLTIRVKMMTGVVYPFPREFVSLIDVTAPRVIYCERTFTVPDPD